MTMFFFFFLTVKVIVVKNYNDENKKRNYKFNYLIYRIELFRDCPGQKICSV